MRVEYFSDNALYTSHARLAELAPEPRPRSGRTVRTRRCAVPLTRWCAATRPHSMRIMRPEFRTDDRRSGVRIETAGTESTTKAVVREFTGVERTLIATRGDLLVLYHQSSGVKPLGLRVGDRNARHRRDQWRRPHHRVRHLRRRRSRQRPWPSSTLVYLAGEGAPRRGRDRSPGEPCGRGHTPAVNAVAPRRDGCIQRVHAPEHATTTIGVRVCIRERRSRTVHRGAPRARPPSSP